MTRAFLPGRWNRHGRAIPDPQACELDNVAPLRPDLPPIRVDMTKHRIPFGRRARRLLRDVWAFLIAPSFRG